MKEIDTLKLLLNDRK